VLTEQERLILIESKLFDLKIRGAKELGHPIPQSIFGRQSRHSCNFQQSDGEKTFSFVGEVEGTVVSVVTFPSGVWYRVDFSSLPEELKGLGWSNSSINMVRSRGSFTRWVNHFDIFEECDICGETAEYIHFHQSHDQWGEDRVVYCRSCKPDYCFEKLRRGRV
jgi:hypothetical protein